MMWGTPRGKSPTFSVGKVDSFTYHIAYKLCCRSEHKSYLSIGFSRNPCLCLVDDGNHGGDGEDGEGEGDGDDATVTCAKV